MRRPPSTGSHCGCEETAIFKDAYIFHCKKREPTCSWQIEPRGCFFRSLVSQSVRTQDIRQSEDSPKLAAKTCSVIQELCEGFHQHHFRLMVNKKLRVGVEIGGRACVSPLLAVIAFLPLIFKKMVSDRFKQTHVHTRAHMHRSMFGESVSHSKLAGPHTRRAVSLDPALVSATRTRQASALPGKD